MHRISHAIIMSRSFVTFFGAGHRYATQLGGCVNARSRDLGKPGSIFFLQPLTRLVAQAGAARLNEAIASCRSRRRSVIDSEESKQELVLLGMRTKRGVDFETFKRLTGQDLLKVQKMLLQLMLEKHERLTYRAIAAVPGRGGNAG